jgi:hypothetical protein
MALETARRRQASPRLEPLPLLKYLPSWRDDETLTEFVARDWPFETQPLDAACVFHAKRTAIPQQRAGVVTGRSGCRTRNSGTTGSRGFFMHLQLSLQQRNLLSQTIAFVPQAEGFLSYAIVQLLMPLGKAPLFGGVRRYPLNVPDKLLIALPDLGERGLRPPLRVTCLFGLQHDAFLDTFEPRRRTVDLCQQGRFMFGVGESQRFDFTKMG